MANSVQEYLKETVIYLNSIGLDVFLHSSTLLQIIRDNDFKERHENDREINLGCLAEDLTDEILSRIINDNKYVTIRNSMYKNNHLIFFSPYWKEKWRRCWDIKPGFTLLAPFYKSGNIRYEYMGDFRCKVWNASHIDKKEDWENVIFNGTQYKMMKDHVGWFDNYFGPSWRVERLTWHWASHGLNLQNWSSIHDCKDYIKRKE